jgi:hypothetical protein
MNFFQRADRNSLLGTKLSMDVFGRHGVEGLLRQIQRIDGRLILMVK